MAQLIHKGRAIVGSPDIPIIEITQATYNANKSYYDSQNAFIKITDAEGYTADDIEYGNGSVADALDEITDDFSKKSLSADTWYTAEKNGFVVVQGLSTSDNGYVWVDVGQTNTVYHIQQTCLTNRYISITVPITKGEQYRIRVGNAGLSFAYIKYLGW